MKKFWIIFSVLVLVIAGGMFAVWKTVSGLEGAASHVDGGVLVWQAGGAVVEERDDSFIGRIRGGDEPLMTELLLALKRAESDERIKGLALDLQGFEVDWAKLEELQAAVREFEASGKPVVAYLDAGMTRDYALAAQADRVVLSPEANIMVLGVVAELDFMKETLGKLGMKADFIHVGAYKSAPERMTRDSASEANREMIAAIVDDRYAALVDMVSQGRGVDTPEAAAWIDQGMFDAEGAVTAGLADTLQYWDDMLDAEFPDQPVTYLSDYILEHPHARKDSPEVALVHITGIIMPGESKFDNFQGKVAGSETVVEQLQAVEDDDDIRALVLRVDSPGGSALASDLIWEAIQRVKARKPVIVSMSGMAASGGYYVSCAADSIFADPGTLTGSIGVYAGKLDRSDMYGKVGVNREFITRGRNALFFSDEGGFSDNQREIFSGQLSRFYERFLAKVAEGRHRTRDEIHAVAQGRVWTGNQGLEHGLVDRLGGLQDALGAARASIGLGPDEHIALVTYGKQLTWMERMVLKSLHGQARVEAGRLLSRATTSPEAASLAPWLELLDLPAGEVLATAALLDGRPVALMPYVIRWR
ncbi:signal peptide peptidase SppA [bacterium CG17_big_fil_post_rev_8_21_14_2_50_64_8]|nr:MAG: signal peptide peptidase SppA [bacterium CG17_big_fil_post_rev_8_21_14_2_50_64_8]PJA75680.1 MAG: signal peptide peptidase SppA [bacterium CG_4_9_14_3_um_filter_65_15]